MTRFWIGLILKFKRYIFNRVCPGGLHPIFCPATPTRWHSRLEWNLLLRPEGFPRSNIGQPLQLWLSISPTKPEKTAFSKLCSRLSGVSEIMPMQVWWIMWAEQRERTCSIAGVLCTCLIRFTPAVYDHERMMLARCQLWPEKMKKFFPFIFFAWR